jgi:tRNA/tmRNA/rRNA uracil-C5-methylase (TrmA/RlmC/RlmD family)
MSNSNFKKKIRDKLPSKAFRCVSMVWNLPFSISGFVTDITKPNLTKEKVKTINTQDLIFQIKLNPKNGHIDHFINKKGYWDKVISAEITSRLKQGDVFLDIGANIGYFSILASTILKGSGEVHSFEPIKSVFNQLKDNIELNELKNVNIHNFALGSESKKSKKI